MIVTAALCSASPQILSTLWRGRCAAQEFDSRRWKRDRVIHTLRLSLRLCSSLFLPHCSLFSFPRERRGTRVTSVYVITFQGKSCRKSTGAYRLLFDQSRHFFPTTKFFQCLARCVPFLLCNHNLRGIPKILGCF